MLHRKISQLCCNGREICVFLRDQQRWIERARIIELEGDLVTIKYETEEDDEMSSWEEIVRLDSIGSISQKLSSVRRTGMDIVTTDDCPDSEHIQSQMPEE